MTTTNRWTGLDAIQRGKLTSQPNRELMALNAKNRFWVTRLISSPRAVVSLNRYLSSLSLLYLISGAAVAGEDVPSPHRVVLTHVTVVDIRLGLIRPNQTVVIEENKIASVGLSDAVAVPTGAQIVEGSGKYLIPGLWDAHVHLSYLGACALPVFVANGVTSVRDAGSRLEDVTRWRKQVAAGELLGPRIKTAGPNLESTEWLERVWKILPAEEAAWQLGPRRPVANPEQAAMAVDLVARLGVDFIKFRNLPRASFRAAMAEATRRGLPVAGHAPHGTTLAEASEAGMKSIEHAETVMLALKSQSKKERLRSFRVLARRGTLLTPTLVADLAARLTPDSVALAIIADIDGARDVGRKYVSAKTVELWRLGLKLKKKYEDSADWRPQYRREVEDMRLAHRAGVNLMAGTDVGGVTGLYPGFSLHAELELLVREVGLTPLEALRGAIKFPLTFLGGGDEVSNLQPGSAADLVLLDANPLQDISNTRRVRAVVSGGKVLQRANLDEVLATVAVAVKAGTGCAEEAAR